MSDNSGEPQEKRIRSEEVSENGEEVITASVSSPSPQATPQPSIAPESEQCSHHSNEEGKESRRPPFTRAHKITRQGGKFHLLIGVTGSVATIKLAELIEQLYKVCQKERLWIKIVATNSALQFIEKAELDVDEVMYEDRDEWSMWQGRADPVLHIELRRWADAMLIAPLDANTLAKIATGLCDNLLTSVVRAWDTNKPLHFAPAMNTFMWDNPITFQQRKTLRDLLRFKEIPPIEKDLMCGDKGMGAMASIQLISSIVAADVRSRFAVYSQVLH